MIRSIGHTNISRAPAAFRASTISQKVFLSMAECKELHPSSTKGITVGLLSTGNILDMVSIASFGTFMMMYLEFFPAFTARMRNKSVSRISCLAADNPIPPTKTACDLNSTSTSLRLFLNSVDPLETMSQMASDRPMLGAISTLSLIHISEPTRPY